LNVTNSTPSFIHIQLLGLDGRGMSCAGAPLAESVCAATGALKKDRTTRIDQDFDMYLAGHENRIIRL
jgi:hypothetical protein